MKVRRVTTVEEARSLAASLNDSSRERMVIVVTSPSGASEPLIDVERVHAEVGDFTDVYVMLTGDPTWEFSASMTPGTQVYGGAGRVYPVGHDWVADPGRSPLRFAFSTQEAVTAATRLIQDAYSAAARTGYGYGYGTVSRSGRSSLATVLVQGTPTDTEAIVQLADGRYGAIKSATVFPGVAASRIFVKGMTLQGRYFPDAGLFDVSNHLPISAQRLGELHEGDVLPVYVTDVAFSACTVELLPGWPVTMVREQVTGSPADDLCDLLSADEVVLARVTFTAEDTLMLSILDVGEGDASRCALSVWDEGPAWLSWPPAEPETDEDPPPTDTATIEQVLESLVGASTPAPLHRQPTPLDLRHGACQPPGAAFAHPSGSAAVQSLSLSLDAARSSSAAHETRANIAEERIRLMAAELLRIEAEVAALRQRGERQEQELTRLKTRYRSTLIRERSEAGQPAAAAFTDPQEEFRWQVNSAWVHRIPAGEKSARPLGAYSIGPDFLDSLTNVEGISVAKVAGVVVEVLTGLAELNPSRRMHPLRSGPGGEEASVRRGGAICWRVALQTSTPSARRLHFWRSAEGIELSRVVVHDDFRP